MNHRDILSKASIREASLGSQGITLFQTDQLEAEQVGYSADPNGRDLTGDADGDWRRDWIVIGRDSLLGDPFFIDTSTTEFAVFTAMHGAGTWDPTPVSPTLEAFLASLSAIQAFIPALATFQNTANRAQFDQDVTTFRDVLIGINGSKYAEHWKAFIQTVVDEMEEQ
jgi:hypothetical protein